MLVKFLVTLLTIFIWHTSPSIAADEGGKIILELEEDKAPTPIDFVELYNNYIQEIELFDKKYPDQAINENFSQDIEDLHPEYSDQEVGVQHKLIRLGVQGRRWYNYFKQKIQQVLTENDIPLQVEDDQYEMGEKEQYQETDKPLVILKQKKVVAYSNLPQDQEAVKDKVYRDAGLLTPYKRKQIMKKAFLEKDWKTLFSYGLFDGNPTNDQKGIGNWVGPKNVAIRLVSLHKSIANQTNIRGILQVYINPQWVMLRYPFKQFTQSELDFSESKNLKNITFNWPVPTRKITPLGQSINGYLNAFEIPFTAEVDNPEQNLNLIAKVSAFVCKEYDCYHEDLSTNLELSAGGNLEETSYSLKIKMAENKSPQKENSKINIKHLYPNKYEDKTNLVLEFSSQTSIDKPNIFIEADKNLVFEQLQILQNENNFKVYFSSPLDEEELIGKELNVLLMINEQNSLLKTIKVEKPSVFDDNPLGLTLKIILSAFGGGLLLNLMPAVLSLWLIKLKEFCKFGRVSPDEAKKEFMQNIIGITIALSSLYVFICLLRIINLNISYAQLFQSSGFLSVSVFIILGIMAYWFEILTTFRINQRIKHIIFGICAVWLAMAYNIPQISKAIEIATNNNSLLQIAVVFLVIGLGFITPYFLAMSFAEFVFYIPYPERWFRGLNNLAYLLLWIALGWLMVLITTQTNGHLWWHTALFLALFWIIILFRHYIIEALKIQEKDPLIYKKVEKFFNWCSTILILLIFIGFYIDVNYNMRPKTTNTYVAQDLSAINGLVKKGRNVLLQIDAGWCLRCHYNNYVIMNSERIQKILKKTDTARIKINMKQNMIEAQQIMHQFKQYELPLYILYTPQLPYGYVLPKILNERDLYNLLSANSVTQGQNL